MVKKYLEANYQLRVLNTMFDLNIIYFFFFFVIDITFDFYIQQALKNIDDYIQFVCYAAVKR
jgi:hypothetical protein